MKKIYIILLVFLSVSGFSQKGTNFWFAPPNITDSYNASENDAVFLNLTAYDNAASVTVTIYATATNLVIPVAANTNVKYDLSAYIASLETKPTDNVLSTGLHILSDDTISVFYEYNNSSNQEIFSLKEANSLGQEFYIPMQNISNNTNLIYADLAYASFDIVATENGTTVNIFPLRDIDGGNIGGQQFSVSLNEGQTYSGGWTGANYETTSTHPQGTVVTSDKPIAISVKDDAVTHSTDGINGDLLGDQIVPVDVIGDEYIIVKGKLDAAVEESFYILATQNATEIYINGNATPIASLFRGETYRYDISAAGNDYTYLQTSKDVYVTHVSGVGTEMSQAILPPINCTGADEVSFVRSSAGSFYLNLVVKSGFETDFDITDATIKSAINSASWTDVPGTSGIWKAVSLDLSSDVTTDLGYVLKNDSSIFILSTLNGLAGSGSRYAYFSDFVSQTYVEAGLPMTICSNSTAVLDGSVTGSVKTGKWTSSGSGIFDDPTKLDAEYTPSPSDKAAGSVVLTLTSTGVCTPVSDNLTLTIEAAPTVDANIDQTVCGNNSDVSLNGSYTIATGCIWTSSGNGSFDDATSETAIYTPDVTDISNGSVRLYLTTTGNASCNAEVDSMDVTITLAPTIDAGINQTVCSNNAEVTLNAITNGVPTGGGWTGGIGSYNPGANALNTLYTPDATEIANGSLKLYVTTQGSGTCNEVKDSLIITFTPSPVVDAGIDQVKCSNNSVTLLNGSVTGGASTGTWSNGLGTFLVDNNDLNASYSPTAGEIASGSVELYLISSNHGLNGCNADKDTMVISFTPSPTVDAGPEEIYICQNNPVVNLSGSIGLPATTAIWSGGAGTFSPSATDLNATYNPTVTEISNANQITLTLTTTGATTCNEVSDQIIVKFNNSPIVEAGAPQTSCENNPSVTLQASVINASGAIWDRANTYFNTDNTDLLAVFTPDATDIANNGATLTLTSTGNGNCNVESDIFQLTIVDAPIVNAGIADTVCANNSTIDLVGTVTNAAGGVWSGGLGNYGDANSLTTTYQPSQTEIDNGFVTLYLTSTGNGTCNAVQSSVTNIITPAPTVYAGDDQTVCANNSDITLDGTLTGAITAEWSGGLGTYTPDNTTLNATYHPDASEISAQSVSLTLTTTDNGICNEVSDVVDFLINPSPIVDAGADIYTCYNNSTATLNGTVTNASGGTWSGGLGVFNPNNTDLGADYTPTQAELDAGIIKLYLTSQLDGYCTQVIDSVRIIIGPKPIVDAGIDQTLCANNPDAVLNGFVNIANGGVWSGGLGTFIPNNSVLNATYTPTQTEISNGFVDLVLTSTGNGSCVSENDVVRINYTSAPTVDAGLDFDVCENNNQIDLSGNITIATGGTWSGGNGTYNPNSTSLITSYIPTATEISNGEVTFYLETTGNGNCSSVIDSVLVTINESPIVDAGDSIDVCVDNLSTDLEGLVSGITNTGSWSTSGSGYFVPNNTTLNASYVCSSADSTAGTVTLTLASTNNNGCLPVKDSLIITILDAGQANAGNDETVCANNSAIYLNGTISGAATGGTWTTNGSGAFVPNANDLNATYIPSDGDTLTGSVILTLTANSCNLAQSSINIYITPAPFVSAGSDEMTCVDNLDIQLDGTVYGATTTGVWTTNGTGTFDPDNTTIDAIYHASSLDSINGEVVLYLNATNIGTCNPVSDSMIISISPAGIVDAGTQQTLCSNNATINLNGSISGGATQGQWSTSGTGVFTPTPNDLNATYTPSNADLSAGTVTLMLTATNSCNFAFDAFDVLFTESPTANIGNDTSLCANLSELPLNGNVTIATGGVWTSNGTGVFLPSNTDLNATYTPSNADISAGNVDIILTTTGNGACNAVTDTLNFEITPSPVVNAGQNQTVCSSADTTQLFGSVYGGASTGVWTTVGSADGTFVDSTDFNTMYVFGPSDVAAGTIQLSLTSTNNDNCLAESDTMTIVFGNSTFAYAGVDQTICGDNLLINLAGIVSGGTSTGTWSGSGTGTFVPNADNLNAGYICSSQDSLVGYVNFVLTTTNNGGCNAGTDSMLLTILPVPVINAGNDIEVCSGTDTIAIAAAVSNVNSLIWTTSGTGTFYPNDTSISAYYIPSDIDTVLGTVQLTVSTLNSGLCNEVSDTVNINFTIPLTVDFGFNLACANQGVNFTDNSVVTSGGIDSWYWEFGDGSVNNNQNPSHTYLASGDYDVTLTVASNLGCSYNKVQTITVFAEPTVNFSYVSSCYLDDVVFSDSSLANEGNISSWSWDFGDSNTSNVQNPTNLFDNSGSYTVSLTVQNSEGCSSSYSQSINVNAKPIANFDYLYNCSNGVVSFNDQSISVNDTINFWNWNFGSGNTSLEMNPDYSFATTGGHSVTLISGTSVNCSDTVTKQVYLQSITADFNFISSCLYDTVSFNDLTYANGDTISQYTWIFGDGNQSNLENPLHLYSEPDTFTVSLIAETNSGCKDTVTKSVEIYPIPMAEFDFNSESYEVNEIVSFTDLSTGANNWQWSFGDGITVSIQNPQHIYSNEGTFTIIQSVSNIYGCVDTALTNLSIENVIAVLPPKLPTAFSPNNDGMNDVFYPRGGPFKSVDFKVYNSWGEQIFNTQKINEGWDGTYKGVDQKVDVYIWTLTAITIDGKEYIKKGDVTLIR